MRDVICGEVGFSFPSMPSCLTREFLFAIPLILRADSLNLKANILETLRLDPQESPTLSLWIPARLICKSSFVQVDPPRPRLIGFSSSGLSLLQIARDAKMVQVFMNQNSARQVYPWTYLSKFSTPLVPPAVLFSTMSFLSQAIRSRRFHPT